MDILRADIYSANNRRCSIVIATAEAFGGGVGLASTTNGYWNAFLVGKPDYDGDDYTNTVDSDNDNDGIVRRKRLL